MAAQVDDIVKLIRLQNIEFFTVSTSGGDNKKIFDSTDEDSTLDDRIARFLKVMDLYHGGRFILKGRRVKNDARSGFEYEFSNLEFQSATPGNTTPMVSGISADEVERRITEALQRDREKRELEDLRKELKDTKDALKSKDTAMNRILESLAPYAGQIAPAVVSAVSGFLGKFSPAGTPIAVGTVEKQHQQDSVFESVDEVEERIEHKNNTEMNDDKNELIEEQASRLDAAVLKLAQNEPEYIELLERVAEMAAANDQTYQMARNFILKK